MDKVKNVVDYSVDEVLNGIIIDAAIDYIKDKKYKVGCGISECRMEEIIYLKELVCNPPCYFGPKENTQINEYVYYLNKR